MIVRFSKELCNYNFKSRFEKQEEDGSVKMVRLVQGTNEVDESKQDKNAKEKPFLTGYANISIDGKQYYQTEITDKSVINFLKEQPYWGTKIVEFDPLADSKAKSEGFKTTAKLLMEVAKMDDTELLSLGYTKLGNRALVLGRDKDFEGLRLELASEVQENPDEMKELMDDKLNGEKLLIGLAFAKGVLVEADSGNSIAWGSNKTKVISVPAETSPLEALVDFFGTVEGREVKKLVHQRTVGDNKAKDKVKDEAEDKADAKTTAAKK